MLLTKLYYHPSNLPSSVPTETVIHLVEPGGIPEPSSSQLSAVPPNLHRRIPTTTGLPGFYAEVPMCRMTSPPAGSVVALGGEFSGTRAWGKGIGAGEEAGGVPSGECLGRDEPVAGVHGRGCQRRRERKKGGRGGANTVICSRHPRRGQPGLRADGPRGRAFNGYETSPISPHHTLIRESCQKRGTLAFLSSSPSSA